MKGFLLRGLIAGAIGGVGRCDLPPSSDRDPDRVRPPVRGCCRYRRRSGRGARVHPGSPAAGRHARRGRSTASILGVVVGVRRRRRPPSARGSERVPTRRQGCGAAFVAVVLVPSLKYPPNPPTVGDPDTISQRTVSYLLLMALGIAVTFGALYFWQIGLGPGLRRRERGSSSSPGASSPSSALAYVVFPTNPDAIRPPNNEADPGARSRRRTHRMTCWSPVAQRRRSTTTSRCGTRTTPAEPLDVARSTMPGISVGHPVAVPPTAGSPRLHDDGVELPGAVARRAGADVRLIAGALGWILDLGCSAVGTAARAARPSDQTASRSRAPVSAEG